MNKSVFALAGLLSTLAVPAVAFSATISALTPADPIEVGDQTQVNLRISGLGDFTAPTLGGFDLRVSYDDSVVSLTDVSFSTWLGGPDPSFPPEWDDTAAGSGSLYEVSLESTEFLDNLQPDAFLLATLYFEGVAQGTSDIDFSNVFLIGADAFASEIAVDELNPGSITVVPLPAAAWLFGSAVIGLAGIGWRRKAV
ncbi:hypothetical protein [Halochromatium glycolicum]|jgi:hypothetical protein|nr:hypothetical protein [Halochromatium glycolicum]